MAMLGLYDLTDSVAQGGHSSHGRILIVSRTHVMMDTVNKRLIHGKTRKTLSHIERLMFGSQSRHCAKYGGAYMG
jgi:hypothetical protein